MQPMMSSNLIINIIVLFIVFISPSFFPQGQTHTRNNPQRSLFIDLQNKNDHNLTTPLPLHLLCPFHQPPPPQPPRTIPTWFVALDSFVHHPATRTLLYIFYHDPPSKERALNLSLCYDWMHPIPLKISPYMDNQVYREVFTPLQSHWKQENISYIITTSYKTLHHDFIPMTTLRDYSRFLLLLHFTPYDFIPLIRTHFPLLKESIRCHGKLFQDGWDAMLLSMGYNHQQIRAIDRVYGFYKNAFITTVPVMIGLTGFMSHALNIMDHNETVKRLSSVNAKYPGTMTKEQLQEAFQSDSYLMYPFILERLPVFYIYHMGFHICDAHSVLCRTNVK